MHVRLLHKHLSCNIYLANQDCALSDKSGPRSCYHLNSGGYADARRLIQGISGVNVDECCKYVVIERCVVSSMEGALRAADNRRTTLVAVGSPCRRPAAGVADGREATVGMQATVELRSRLRSGLLIHHLFIHKGKSRVATSDLATN